MVASRRRGLGLSRCVRTVPQCNAFMSFGLVNDRFMTEEVDSLLELPNKRRNRESLAHPQFAIGPKTLLRVNRRRSFAN
jgi:hypothetical protein